MYFGQIYLPWVGDLLSFDAFTLHSFHLCMHSFIFIHFHSFMFIHQWNETDELRCETNKLMNVEKRIEYWSLNVVLKYLTESPYQLHTIQTNSYYWFHTASMIALIFWLDWHSMTVWWMNDRLLLQQYCSLYVQSYHIVPLHAWHPTVQQVVLDKRATDTANVTTTAATTTTTTTTDDVVINVTWSRRWFCFCFFPCAH